MARPASGSATRAPRASVLVGAAAVSLLTASLLAIACAGSQAVPEQPLPSRTPNAGPADAPAASPDSPDPVGAPEAADSGESGADHQPAADAARAATGEPAVDAAPAGGGAAGDDSVVIIEAVPEGSPPPDLVAAAQAERDRRQSAPPSSVTITDKSLPDYATGELTYVEPAEAGQPAAAEAMPAPGPTEESYWRERVRDIRLDWREASERVGELEAKAAQLRRDFYAADDGYYRDSRIKPAWDRALADLEAAKAAVEETQETLAAALEDGRRAGALPGWLREGIELEPRAPDPEPPPADPREPEVVEVIERDGGGR